MLEMKNVSVRYGKSTALDRVSVSFEKGRLVSIVGANGCGKSTLLKALLGIIPCAEGEIRLEGCELASMPRKAVAQKLAYLAQGKSTPDMTVMQMVLHGRFPYLAYPRRYTEEDRAIAYAAMEWVGIRNLASRHLNTLSGGMRQNAYIAMALAQDTDYILLDEPATYLDISRQLELMKILRGLADEGKGVMIVTHDLPLAFDFSDEIVLLREGEIVSKEDARGMSRRRELEEIFGVGVGYLEKEDKYCYRYPSESTSEQSK